LKNDPEYMENTISIIMPVFNEEKHLRACLDSILVQSCSDWELLAVDDASTDHSLDLLLTYNKKDPRIRVLENYEKGIIPALRVAVNAAKGSFITRMDADDYMPPHKLEALRKPLLEKGPGHLSTALVEYFSDEFDLGPGYRRYADWLNQVIRQERNWEEIYRECTIPSPCWMCWRQDFFSAGAHNSNINPEDYDLAFRFYKSGLKITSVPDILHFWRDHARRSSRNLESHANQEYFRLKVPSFIEIDYDANRPLILWGAGRKGKEIAKMLLEKSLNFHWCCETPAKWGHNIYGVIVESPQTIDRLPNAQIILAVSAPSEQPGIHQHLTDKGLLPGKDFFWFC
jgi:glycosyltransferase involved in cell wall biosynthesis